MDTRDPASTSWRDLIIDFTQNTTCHGIRYLGLPTRYWAIRRLLWIVIILCAATAFTYLASIKLHQYYKYEKTVSVEVVHQQQMTFPAVTLCNLNQFKLTPMHELGLIDALSVLNSEGFVQGQEVLPWQSFGGSRYYYNSHLCSLPNSVIWKQTYASLSRQMCATLCSRQHDTHCTSVLYNQTDQSCTLSSYSVNAVAETTVCDVKGPMEFYHRQRHYDENLSEIICTFEKSTRPCPFQQEVTGSQREDQWLVRSAEGRVPDQDLTLESGDGQYLLFSETARKPGYRARYISPFINATGKCLNLFYRFLGGKTSLSLILRTPDMVEHPVSMVSGSQPTIEGHVRTDFGGKQLKEELPHGEYQVILEAKRNRNPSVTSGAVLDNLLILDCASLDAEDCMRSRIGRDYTGHTSRTESGKKCIDWAGVILDDGSFYTEDMFPDRSLQEAGNSCRNPGGSGMEAPYCHYRTPQGIVAKERCNISYCSCIGSDMFHCTSGLCVPRKLLCDGTDHCGDGSDEQEECASKQSVSCTLETSYLCGYRSHTDLVAQWMWHRSDSHSTGNEPLTDSAGSSLGHYLLLDNRAVHEGDTALITSPLFTTQGNVSLSFFIYTQYSDTDVFSGFHVYLLNPQGRVLADLYSSDHTSPGKQSTWRKVSLCLHLPAGSYYIQLKGIVGEPYRTVVAVDDIKLADQSDCSDSVDNRISVVPDTTTWSGCNFESGDSCPLTHAGWSTWVVWQPVPLQYLEEIIYNSDTAPSVLSATGAHYCKQTDGQVEKQQKRQYKCKVQLYNMEGDIMSPDFPSQYKNNVDFKYRIILPTVTNITLTSDYMDIEKDKSCSLDYLKTVVKRNGSLIDSASTRLCGRRRWDETVEADTVTLNFHSDRALAGRGFYLHYKVDKVPGVDYMLGLSNRGRETHNVTKPYLSYLDFPMVYTVHTDYCLTFWALIGASLDVVLVTKDSQQLLTKIQRMLFWREYSVPIPAQDSAYFIQFRSDVVVQSTVFVEYVNFINNVSFTDGSCVQDQGSVKEGGSCDFDVSLCGYTEESESFSTWRRTSAPDVANSYFFQFNYTTVAERLGKSIMLVHFDTKTDVALLRSPVIDTKRQKCLRLDYLCRVYPQNSFSVVILQGTRRQRLTWDPQRSECESNTWISLNGTLPRGDYQIQIEASASVSRNAWAYYAIDNINITVGACDNSGATFEDSSSSSGYVEELVLPTSRKRGDNTYRRFNVTVMAAVEDKRGPELGEISVMIKSKTDMKVKQIEEMASHNIQDMILRCRYNYKPCSAADFQQTLTELGVCYTFNGNHDNQSTTDNTGSGSGLALLLNIEHYEHLPGRTSQPGIKVFLHDPREIAYNKYVGVAIPPGMNSLMAIQHQQSELLDEPYGNCSTDPDPYYPDEPYTRYRCERRCQSQYLEEECGCIRDFMPGNEDSQVCSLSETLACAYPKSELTGDVLSSDCVCHEACSVSRYGVDLSYTRLSELNVDLYLSENQQRIERHLQQARELQSRLAISEPDTLLEPLTNLQQAHTEFLQTINFHVIDKYTSTVELVKEVISLIQQQAAQDIKQTLFSNVTHLRQMYNTRVSHFWDAILNPMSELLTQAQNYANLLTYLSTNVLISNSSDGYTSPNWIEFVEQHFLELLSHIPSVLNMYVEQKQLLQPHSSSDLPVKYSLYEDYCSEQITSRIVPMLQNLSSLVEELNITSSSQSLQGSDATDHIEGVYSMIEQLSNWNMLDMQPLCVKEYQSLLDNLTQYLSTIKSSGDLSMFSEAFLAGVQMEKLQKDAQTLDNITTQYLNGNLAKIRLSRLLDVDYILQLKADMQDVYSAMKTGMFRPLEVLSQQLPARLSSWYSEALTLAAKLGDYLTGDPSALEPIVRGFGVWRKPRPDLQNPQLITYISSSPTQTWPLEKDMAQFQDSGVADFLLSSIFQRFFTELRKDLHNLEVVLEEQLQKADLALTSIQGHLVEFKDKARVTGDFVRDNFVDVNIFYGELKYDSIREQPAYDIPTFFSDMGGFMGLLLGASIITLAEVLDLFIYNAVIKLTLKGHKRYKQSIRKRQSGRNVNSATSEDLNHSVTDGVNRAKWGRYGRTPPSSVYSGNRTQMDERL